MNDKEKLTKLKAIAQKRQELLDKQKRLLAEGKEVEASRIMVAIKIAQAEFKRIANNLRNSRFRKARKAGERKQ